MADPTLEPTPAPTPAPDTADELAAVLAQVKAIKAENDSLKAAAAKTQAVVDQLKAAVQA